jgi:DNA-binding GntR family transcriptional regulator
MTDDSDTRRAKGTGARFAYETIRDEILTLALEPGRLLDETSLADRFGMSRSPVREALIRLAAEGLVVTLANRSTIVAANDVTSFPKYVEALDLAQRMNTRLAAEYRTEADLAAIARAQDAFEAAVRGGDHLQMSATNKEFHMAIALAGRNPYLATFYERLLDQGRRMLHLHFDYLERTRDGTLLTGEHAEMLSAIRDRDCDRADALAHSHTRQFRDNFFRYLQENHAPGLALSG